MAQVDIPWPITAQPGRKPGESQGTLVNAYAARIGEKIRIRRTPGLRRKVALANGTGLKPRGLFEVSTSLLNAWTDRMLLMQPDGTNVAVISPLAGSTPIIFAKNMRPITPDVVMVTIDQGAFIYDLADNTVKPYPAGAVGAVESVEYFSGYFFFTRRDGTILASELQSTDVEALSVASSEYVADELFRCKSTGNALAVMSSKSIEFWVDVAGDPFPLQRQSSIDAGLIGPYAVAGGSSEWENGLLWVSGDCTVRMLHGYDPVVVSNDDVVADIKRSQDRNFELFAQVYTFNAQAFWSLTGPDFTWEYNLVTKGWNKRESFSPLLTTPFQTLPFWRARFASRYGQRWMCQDIHMGMIHEIDPDYFQEDTERVRYRVESGPVKQFPVNFRIPSIDFDMTSGLGSVERPSPFETNPAVMVSWSHDGGANWSNPLARSLGQQGRYANKVTVNNLGRSTSKGVMIRVECVDPVWVSLESAISTRTKASRPRQVLA
jgi:hypothetical protein